MWLTLRGTRHKHLCGVCLRPGDTFPGGFYTEAMCEHCIAAHGITPLQHCPFGLFPRSGSNPGGLNLDQVDQTALTDREPQGVILVTERRSQCWFYSPAGLQSHSAASGGRLAAHTTQRWRIPRAVSSRMH